MYWDLGGGFHVPGNAQPGRTPPTNSYPPPMNYHVPSTDSSLFMPIGVPSPTSHPTSPTFPRPPVQQTHSYPGSYQPIRMPTADLSRAVHVVQTSHSQQSHTRRHVRVHASRTHVSQPQRESVLLPEPVIQERAGHFPCSKCTGKKKAVCIGINYFGTEQQLRGCINDAKSVRNFLITYQNYKPDDIVLLTDDATDSRLLPTRQNITNAMKWLVHEAHPHDALFFHFSGHGNQVPDKDGDEIDGFDEVIFPVDFRDKGVIIDDEMHSRMVKPLPEFCRLTALFDSCHSGSVLDLPYLYHTDGRIKGSQVTASHFKEKSTIADVISWSGCMDSQTSADTFNESGVAVGAMSYAFMKSLKAHPHQNYQQLLRSIRSILHDKYSQKPQLSSSHHIDTTEKFIM